MTVKPKLAKTVDCAMDREDESEEEDSRIYAAVGFAFILLVIGVPLWWKTTEVYRVPLPYNRIANLENVKFKLVVNVTIMACTDVRADQLKTELEDIFKASKFFHVNFVPHLATQDERQEIGRCQGFSDLENLPFHPKKPGHILLLEVHGLARFTGSHIGVGLRRAIYFSSDTVALKLADVLSSWLLQESSAEQMVSSMMMPTKVGLDKIGQRRMPPSKDYDILFTLVNPEPEKLRLHWNIQEAVQNHILPFLDELPLANYTIKSQVLYFVNLDVTPKVIANEFGQHYGLDEDTLHHIITPLEKKLASHMSQNPTLNFVVYVPTCDDSPLYIYSKQLSQRVYSNAFLSPRWGGIHIYNPSCTQGDNHTEPFHANVNSGAVMGVFLPQMRQLLGIPDVEPLLGVELLPSESVKPREWELDLLMRVRSLEQVTSAQLTLQSLSQLLGEISNIVINDDVGMYIYRAVDAVERVALHLEKGELVEGFTASKEAFLSAETAFTDSTLLALLYFPDDQKYAVYIPLFLPVGIPVILSLRNIFNWGKKKLSARKEKVE